MLKHVAMYSKNLIVISINSCVERSYVLTLKIDKLMHMSNGGRTDLVVIQYVALYNVFSFQKEKKN